MKEEINLVYIASNGHSGSTLLELLLNSFDNIWTMGEASVIPWEIVKHKVGCGCGRNVSRCDFWSTIRKKTGRLLSTGGTINMFRESNEAGKVIRPKEILRMMFGRTPSGEKFSAFCNDNKKLFSVVKEEAEKKRESKLKYLVDSSKTPYRLFWLNMCGGVEVKTIHIIKEPRGFVYSMGKNDKSWALLRKAIRMSLRYVLENFFIERAVKKGSNGNYILVHYEDLASNPEKTLKKLAHWLDVPYSQNATFSFKERRNHGVAGNNMRYHSKKIVLDEKWKKHLGSSIKFLVFVLTYFSAKKYGYFK